VAPIAPSVARPPALRVPSPTTRPRPADPSHSSSQFPITILLVFLAMAVASRGGSCASCNYEGDNNHVRWRGLVVPHRTLVRLYQAVVAGSPLC
jgi:hypothetical protein